MFAINVILQDPLLGWTLLFWGWTLSSVDFYDGVSVCAETFMNGDNQIFYKWHLENKYVHPFYSPYSSRCEELSRKYTQLCFLYTLRTGLFSTLRGLGEGWGGHTLSPGKKSRFSHTCKQDSKLLPAKSKSWFCKFG